MQENIHPDFNLGVPRADKEKLLNQKSKVFWFTGLSGSGKSTIANAFEKKLYEKGYYTQILDGDNVRHGINSDLGFSLADRNENVRRVSNIAQLMCQNGTIVISTFISPTKASRAQAREIIGDEDFIEVFVDTPLEICEKRDIKGLYQKARAGEIKDFSGIDSPYEVPKKADIVLNTYNTSIDEVVDKLLTFAIIQIKE